MPVEREIYRENSSSRVICNLLEQRGALTQAKLASAGGFTMSCACKCLNMLIVAGYVKRGPRAPSRMRTSIGPRPWTYTRTGKPLPDPSPTGRPLPAAPAPQELCDIMNELIRRSRTVPADRKNS